MEAASKMPALSHRRDSAYCARSSGCAMRWRELAAAAHAPQDVAALPVRLRVGHGIVGMRGVPHQLPRVGCSARRPQAEPQSVRNSALSGTAKQSRKLKYMQDMKMTCKTYITQIANCLEIAVNAKLAGSGSRVSMTRAMLQTA